MRRSILVSAVVIAGYVAASANAQTKKQDRECRWYNGVESCTLTTDYGDYKSKQVCDYPGGSISNSTCTTARINNAAARENKAFSLDDEARKAAARAASGYRDPPGSTQR